MIYILYISYTYYIYYIYIYTRIEVPTHSWPIARGSGIVAIFQFQKSLVACCALPVANATNIVVKANRRANRAEFIYNSLRGSFPVAVASPQFFNCKR